MGRSTPSHHNSQVREGLFPPDFISKSIVLNLDERIDRLSQTTEELQKVGVRFERFAAIKHAEGWKGYNQSILAILNRTEGWGNIFLVEDDCSFIGDVSHVKRAVRELPDNWDGLWLGSNLQGVHTNKHSAHLYKLENGWNTHAIILSPKFRKWCLENYQQWENIPFDEFLRVNQPNKNCYVVYPMVAIQRASYSNIINDFANYESRFEEVQQFFL